MPGSRAAMCSKMAVMRVPSIAPLRAASMTLIMLLYTASSTWYDGVSGANSEVSSTLRNLCVFSSMRTFESRSVKSKAKVTPKRPPLSMTSRRPACLSMSTTVERTKSLAFVG